MDRHDKSLGRRSVALSASFVWAGLMAYALLAVAKRRMSPSDFSTFSVYWSFGFLIAATIASPIEQELTRAVAHRDARKEFYGGDIRSAATIAAILCCGGVVFAAAATTSGLLEGLDSDYGVLSALAILITGVSITALVRGVLAGTTSTSALALVVAGESTIRTVLVVVAVSIEADASLAAVGVAISSVTSLVFVRRLVPVRVGSERAVDTAGFSRSGVARLAAAAPFSAAFSVGTPALASLYASATEHETIGDVLAALSLTSAPVMVAAALQAALTPTLVRSLLAGSGDAVRATTRRIIAVVLVLAAVAAACIAAIGPALLRVLFGPSPGVGRAALSGMTFAAGLLFLANMLVPVCIARRSHGSVTRAWASGAAVLMGLMLIPAGLADRVAIAVLGGAAVVAGSLIASLRAVWRSDVGPARVNHVGYKSL